MNPSWRKNYLRYKTYFLNVVARYKEREDVKVYLEILLSLLTISVFAVFALRPTLITIAQLIKDIQGKKETVAKMDEKIGKINKAKVLYDSEKERIALLDTAIPAKPQAEVFIRQIEGLVGKDNTLLDSFQTGKVVLWEKNQNQPYRKSKLLKLCQKVLVLSHFL